LQDRIDELSAAIDTQKLVLRDLMSKRSDAYEQLNLFVDPMARIPLELQSEIFVHCLAQSSTLGGTLTPDPTAPPVVFLAVSRLWRDIALATPGLWTGLRMKLPCTDNHVELCRIWMKRAPEHASFSLALNGKLVVGRSVRDLLAEFSNRLQRLTLIIATESGNYLEDRKIDLGLGVRFSLLKSLTICRANGANLDVLDCIHPLNAAPALLECNLRNLPYYRDAWTDIHPVVHSSLQQLQVGYPWPWPGPNADDGGLTQSSAQILRHLTLPALKALFLTQFDVEMVHFTAFLARSSAPLEFLYLSFQALDSEINLADCFQHMPSLKSLTLDGNGCFPVLSIVATSPHILPNLRHITL
ncbi:hypothetical protein R3P38DRAFT_2445663, partial [Favolaschia claudopus]